MDVKHVTVQNRLLPKSRPLVTFARRDGSKRDCFHHLQHILCVSLLANGIASSHPVLLLLNYTPHAVMYTTYTVVPFRWSFANCFYHTPAANTCLVHTYIYTYINHYIILLKVKHRIPYSMGYKIRVIYLAIYRKCLGIYNLNDYAEDMV